MNVKKRFILAVLALFFIASCRDPYNPEIKNLDKEILVVEGFIDGADMTTISLSRVRSMGGNDTGYQKFVTNASVVVEDDLGNQYPLYNAGNGDYRARYYFYSGRRYRTHIRLTDNREYVSDFVQYKISPPVDSISYRIEPDGARFFVSTHDQSGQSKYYRWKYEETWEFHSFYHTEHRFDPVPKAVVHFPDSVYRCWQFDDSKKILINSTEKLGEDRVHEASLLFIPNGSFKLSDLYSIHIRQFVMDSLGFNYYRQLKKNTEETGSIFDPQPGNLRGNVFNIHDSTEIVVGYIGAGSSYKQRNFFRIPWNYKQDCSDIVLVPNVLDSLIFYLDGGGYWPIGEQMGDKGTVYPSARNECVNCTLRGTNIKPAYWP